MLQIVTTVCSYLSPTILFLLLNLVIATILFTSKPHNPTSTNPTPLARAPSLVLDRLKSFNLRSFSLHPPEPETHTIAPEEHAIEEHHIDRSKSDTKPTAGEVLEKLPKKMKKSATMKSAFSHFEFGEAEFEEAVEKEREDNAVKRRPATMRERARVDDVEVDAKCDDFINRFKEQLKLQRMDSIIRYKEMLNRGN